MHANLLGWGGCKDVLQFFFYKITNTGLLPFVLIVSQNNAYREGCKQELIKIDQNVLF